MKNIITEVFKGTLFCGLITGMTVLIYNLYAMKTGGPMVW